MVSIIMPVKNAELFLSATLDSIINQSLSEWELIAVNDFSTDRSEKILSDYAKKDKRIRFLNNSAHGIIPALELAFSMITFPLVTRMDADDIMDRNKLLILSKKLLANGNGHVATAFVKYFSDTTLQGGFLRYESWLNNLIQFGEFRAERFRECVLPSPCWMAYASDIERIGGITNKTYPEDYELCLRMIDHGLEIVGVEQILHHWRDHQKRASRTDDNYKDNLFTKLKAQYLKKELLSTNKTLALLGAGKKAKKIAQALLLESIPFYWATNNQNKVGHDIYGVMLRHSSEIIQLPNTLLIVAVSGPEDQNQIAKDFNSLGLKKGKDYYFFC